MSELNQPPDGFVHNPEDIGLPGQPEFIPQNSVQHRRLPNPEECTCTELIKTFLIRPMKLSFTCPKHGKMTLDTRSIPNSVPASSHGGVTAKFMAPGTLR